MCRRLLLCRWLLCRWLLCRWLLRCRLFLRRLSRCRQLRRRLSRRWLSRRQLPYRRMLRCRMPCLPVAVQLVERAVHNFLVELDCRRHPCRRVMFVLSFVPAASSSKVFSVIPRMYWLRPAPSRHNTPKAELSAELTWSASLLDCLGPGGLCTQSGLNDRSSSVFERQTTFRRVDHHVSSILKLAKQDGVNQRLLDLRVDQSRHRAGAEGGVVTVFGQPGAGGLGQLQGHVLGAQLHAQLVNELVDYTFRR